MPVGDSAELIESGSALLHYPDGRIVAREIPIIAGRAPGEFDTPVAGDSYERFRLRIWDEGVIHYDLVEWVGEEDSGPT